MIVPDFDESLLRNRSFGPIVRHSSGAILAALALGSDREWGDFKQTYGMSESGTILLEFVDFCHELPDEFCPVFLRTL
jgi:hypothetical protein